MNARIWSILAAVTLLATTMHAWLPTAIDPSAEQATSSNDPSPLAVAASKYQGELLAFAARTDLAPEAAAKLALHEQSMHGRAPMAWLEWVQDEFGMPRDPTPLPAPEPLSDAVARLYAAAGVRTTPADAAAAQKSVASVPPALQSMVADVVGTVAIAYAEQAAVAPTIIGRFHDDPYSPAISIAEREQMARRAATIVDAIGTFNARWQQLPAALRDIAHATCLAPLGADCLAYLGSSGADSYTPNPAPMPDPILILEPDGSDLYTNSAGGANPAGAFVPGNGIALSVVADIAGDDAYTYVGEPSVVQGSGSVGGLGILVDVEGQDDYVADYTRSSTPAQPAGIQYYFDGGAQGYGYAGLGLQLDGSGDDLFLFNVTSTEGLCIWGFAQGFGGLGGLGVSWDAMGTDVWASNGNGLTGGDDCWGDGFSRAFEGLYTQGVGFFGGVGLMLDTGAGDDDYPNYLVASNADYYAQGFGAIGGLGILFDDGGDDTYVAYEEATDPNPFPNPTLNCAFGTASLGGVGVMVEGGGDDSYVATTVSTRDVVTMMEGDSDIFGALSLFVEVDGTDHHEAVATPGAGFTGQIFGRGLFDATFNIVGLYLDAGGDTDTYIPSPPGANNAQWTFGADV